MKRKLLLVAGLVLVFILIIVVKFFIIDPWKAYGYIDVSSSPDATVFIDGEPKGKTPLVLKLKKGPYTLKLIPIREEGETESSVSWEKEIEVLANTTTVVSRELGPSDVRSAGETLMMTPSTGEKYGNDRGEIEVESTPSNAIMSLDGQEKGVTAISLANIKEGDHEVSLYLPKFRRRTILVTVKGGQTTKIIADLGLDEHEEDAEGTKMVLEEAATASAQITKLPTVPKTSVSPTSGAKGTKKIVILDTPTGFLRVRSEPSVSGAEVGRVDPGKEFDYIEQSNGWYKIKLSDTEEGWVSGEYVDEK